MLSTIVVPRGISFKLLGKTLKISNFKEKGLTIKLSCSFIVKLYGKRVLLLSFCPTHLKKSKIKKRDYRYYFPLQISLKKKIEHVLFGVSVGFIKQLNLVGIGYKVEVLNNSSLVLKLGFSHRIIMKVPTGIKIFCPDHSLILLKSSSRDLLGFFVSEVQRLKTPDIYKNKGLLRKENILQKKKFKK